MSSLSLSHALPCTRPHCTPVAPHAHPPAQPPPPAPPPHPPPALPQGKTLTVSKPAWRSSRSCLVLANHDCHTGNREEIDRVAASWLELLIGMLLYGLPSKAATRHAVGPIISQCITTRADPGTAPPAGLFLTLIEELLPVRVQAVWLVVLCGCGALHRAVLGQAALCCAVLCCAVLCCAAQ